MFSLYPRVYLLNKLDSACQMTAIKYFYGYLMCASHGIFTVYYPNTVSHGNDKRHTPDINPAPVLEDVTISQ